MTGKPISETAVSALRVAEPAPGLLFSPLTLRGLTLRNRIVVAPMLTYSATRGFVNDWHLMHYGRLAAGGAGLVFLESTKVDPRGCSTPADLGLWKDEFVEPLRRIVQLMRRSGAASGIQLSHSGRKARKSVPWEGRAPLNDCPGVDHGEPWEIIGPSALPHAPGYPTPRAMTGADIRQIVEAWGEAARRADEAGFDAVEIHGAHGYLIHQFLSTVANQRTDEYGGTLQNRMRLACEVARSVRSRWPAHKPLFFRISAVDDAGWDIDHSIALANALKAEGVDVIDCSSGGMLDGASPVESPTYGYQVKYAQAIREQARIAAMAVGMIVHADQAERILRDGQADLAALGRELLHNPNWPLDAAQKLDIRNAFGVVAPSSGYWLEKRAQNRDIRPSTWQPGIDVPR